MTETNLPFIQQQMIRYGMTVYLVLGLLGNIFNCLMFTRYSYRRAPSSVYFLWLSIFAIIYLLWSVIPFMYTLDHPDPQTQSIVYCKARLYGSVTLGQCLRYVVVFACVDRFIATRTNVRVRAFNSVPTATKLVFLTLIVWLVACIHMPIFMEIRNGVCGMFASYKLIYTIYQISLVGILPPILMCIFSALTIRSLQRRHIARAHTRQKDRDFMRMVVAEVIVNVVTSIPYSSNLVYSVITSNVPEKSARRLEIESFVFFLTQFLIYLISVSPFYLFVSTSKPFRNEFIRLIFKIPLRVGFRGHQIDPINELNMVTRTNGTRKT